MNPQTEARLEKVKRMSRSARRACLFLMVFVSLMAAVMALSTVGLPESMTCDVNGIRRPCSNLAPQVVAYGYVALFGVIALVLAALYRFARLFGNYSRGELFTRASVRELRFVGYVAVANAVFQGVLFVAALVLAAEGAVDSPASLGADFPFGPILVAAFILLLSWIMDVGAEIREENELTV